MTPGARISAAIEILNTMADGVPAEQALTRWARGSRYAGSKDRAAVRDHVFDVLRQRRLAAHLGAGETGRALMIGVLRAQGVDLGPLFNGQGHAPLPLSEDETTVPDAPSDPAVLWNLPDWIIPLFQASLGARADTVAQVLQSRAPISVRVNTAQASVANVAQALAEAGIETRANDLCETALTVTAGERKLRNSDSYLHGDVELQDAASQAVVAALPAGTRMLDYCAGGGGKALAMAARRDVSVFAHDIDPRRIIDLPARAERAGATVKQLETDALEGAAPYDVVLCDAPCSGSGSWRRSPEGKWTFTASRLEELTHIQDKILDHAATLTAETGTLAYATCSVLQSENEDRAAAFVARNSGGKQVFSQRFEVDSQGDGFFTAHFQRV